MGLLLIIFFLLKLGDSLDGEDVNSAFFSGTKERHIFLHGFRKPTTLFNMEEYRANEDIYTIKIIDTDTEEITKSPKLKITPNSSLSKTSSTEDPQKHQEKLKKPHFLDKITHTPAGCGTTGEPFTCPYCHIQFLVTVHFQKTKDKQ